MIIRPDVLPDDLPDEAWWQGRAPGTHFVHRASTVRVIWEKEIKSQLLRPSGGGLGGHTLGGPPPVQVAAEMSTDTGAGGLLREAAGPVLRQLSGSRPVTPDDVSCSVPRGNATPGSQVDLVYFGVQYSNMPLSLYSVCSMLRMTCAGC